MTGTCNEISNIITYSEDPRGRTPHISGRGGLARYLGVLIYQHHSIVWDLVSMGSELIVWGFDS